METEVIGLYATLLTVLIGIIPGIWALVKQYRKDVADSKRGEAEAAKTITDASSSIVQQYESLTKIMDQDRAEVRRRMEEQGAQIEELLEAQEKLRQQLDKATNELELTRQALSETQRINAALTETVAELEKGIDKLIEQIRAKGEKPAWTNGRKRTQTIEVDRK